MNVVLAAVDAEPGSRLTVDAATALAELLDGRVELLHVDEVDGTRGLVETRFGTHPLRTVSGDPADAIIEAAERDDVAVLVIGARRVEQHARAAGHVTASVVEHLAKPVVVVPPSARPRRVRRALVPLEGTSATTSAVAEFVSALGRAEVELVPVHVLDLTTCPACWDQSGHAHDSYATSFAERWWSPTPGAVDLRRGSATAAIVDAATHHDVDLIVLSWNRTLAPGHASVVRAVLHSAPAPVLLLPVADDRPTDDEVAQFAR